MPIARWHRSVFLVPVTLIVASLTAVAGPLVASGQSPSAGPETAGVSTASHVLPLGATASVDADTWSLADRLTTSDYTADTTAALLDGLSRSGIATLADASSTTPEVALSGPASPLQLLDFQTHSLAVGAWAGSVFSGAELDRALPLPAGSTDLPTTSELVAAYVATADSPGGALSRALMSGEDLLGPSSARFPAVVLVLFASDIATDGGRVDARGPSPQPTAAAGAGSALLALAGKGTGVAADSTMTAAAAGGFCTQTADWVQGAINGLFAALQLATPSNLPGAIITAAWDWLVDTTHAFVDGLISSVTDYVLGSIRSIAATVATVAEEIATLLPYSVKVVATGDPGGATFLLGPDPLPGRFTATVTAGDLPGWPAILDDCAKAADIQLADFRRKHVQLTWEPLNAPVPALLAGTGTSTADVTDANGQATWPFLVSSDPGDPTSEQRNQSDYLTVHVFRPEVDDARQRLSTALFGSIPRLLRPYVAAIFAPLLDGIQRRLNALLEARGTGTAILVYHASLPPTPVPAVTPVPTPACPIAMGSYSGTNTSAETIKDRPSVTRERATGPMSMVVAADGSVTGTWSYAGRFVYDAEVAGLRHHHVSTSAMTGGIVSGTACDVVIQAGKVRTTSCTDSLKGDCMDVARDPGPRTTQQHLGPPTSVNAGKVVWKGRYDVPGDGLTSSWSVTLTRP